MSQHLESWGRYPKAEQKSRPLYWRTDSLPTESSILPFGMGRSYGDVAFNTDGTAITTSRLNHLISFDSVTGRLICEAGVTLADILQFTVPHGWFLAVTPGTKFISVGGAIANDVHGKNHHVAGTFGHHVIKFELLRSDGSRLICSATENTELFHATTGGLGLTGLITWAEIQLKKIFSPSIITTVTKTGNIEESVDKLTEASLKYEYVIASLDNSAKGASAGRGAVIMGNHDTHSDAHSLQTDAYRPPKITLPDVIPMSLVHAWNSKLFSSAYFRIQRSRHNTLIHYEPFFYPQDAVGNWNFLYGKKGFLQHQCLIPKHNAKEVLREMLQKIVQAGFCSPLTTLKQFGTKESLGLLSWPKEGFSLALDFPNTGKNVLNLFNDLDHIVLRAEGSLYPAKDARMTPEMFQQSFPRWQEFEKYKDPAFTSNFWKRVTNNPF